MRRVSSEDGVDLDRYTNVPLKAAPTRYSDPRAHELRAEYLVTFHADEVPVPVESIAEDLLGLRIEERDLGDSPGCSPLGAADRRQRGGGDERRNPDPPPPLHDRPRCATGSATRSRTWRSRGRARRVCGRQSCRGHACGRARPPAHPTGHRPKGPSVRCGMWRCAYSHSCRPSVAGSPSNSPPSATAEDTAEQSPPSRAARQESQSDVIATRQTSPDAVWNINHVARETQEVGGFAFVVHRSSRPAPSTPPTARPSRTGGCAPSARRVLVRGA